MCAAPTGRPQGRSAAVSLCIRPFPDVIRPWLPRPPQARSRWPQGSRGLQQKPPEPAAHGPQTRARGGAHSPGDLSPLSGVYTEAFPSLQFELLPGFVLFCLACPRFLSKKRMCLVIDLLAPNAAWSVPDATVVRRGLAVGAGL